MGAIKNITMKDMPKQGPWLHNRVRVFFHYNTEEHIMGTLVRQDMEEPGVDIIKLDDGRYLLSTECQYQPI